VLKQKGVIGILETSIKVKITGDQKERTRTDDGDTTPFAESIWKVIICEALIEVRGGCGERRRVGAGGVVVFGKTT